MSSASEFKKHWSFWVSLFLGDQDTGKSRSEVPMFGHSEVEVV